MIHKYVCLNKQISKYIKIDAVSLPIFSVYNMRSIWSKLSSLAEDMEERETDLTILSEVWEKKENKNHKSQIETLLEIEGLRYISTPRPSGWGGAGLIVNQSRFSIEKLNISIPDNLEVVWGLLKPKDETAKFKRIIICSFYSPPQSKKNLKLTDHLVSTLQVLNAQYPDAPMMLGADKNNMNIRPLLTCGLRLRQVVYLPTRNGVILDILLLSILQYYNAPTIVPLSHVITLQLASPVTTMYQYVYPTLTWSQPAVSHFKTVTYRPLPESGRGRGRKFLY